MEKNNDEIRKAKQAYYREWRKNHPAKQKEYIEKCCMKWYKQQIEKGKATQKE